ncbi:short-chain dehydrogenase-like protein [Flagelloscypha sp. PMI_526]|nr:short-chain dehydrogenase-like protein [Flagelloscypha sp. PMI_526]
MSSILVTGSARGLGFGLVQLLASKPASEVKLIFASARKPNDALDKVAASHPGRVHLIELEVADAESAQKAAEKVETILKEHKATLDVLVNNAGVLTYSPEGVQTMPVTDLEEMFRINVFGVQIVTTAFLPLLRKGKGKKVVNISTGLGSLTLGAHFTMFPAPAYKISKAAANMLTIQWANDFGKEGFSFVALSPGWVKTDMGTEQAELTVDQSVNGILQVINKIDGSFNGKFLDVEVRGWEPTPVSSYNGGAIPW